MVVFCCFLVLFGVALGVILERSRRLFRKGRSRQRHLGGFWPPRGRSAARLFVRSMEPVGNGAETKSRQRPKSI